MTRSARNAIPWWGKLGAKLILANLGLSHGVWRRLGVFQHGAMDDPQTAIDIFRLHYDRWASRRAPQPGFVMLELGPGDGLLSGMVARAFGASASYLVDTGADAAREVEPFRRLAAALRALGHAIGDPPRDASLEAVLAHYRIHYMTDGLASLAAIAPASVDFAFSQAVLEHVRRADFAATLTALRRVLKPGGLSSHVIDLQDHLGGSLNNLRFDDWFWECDRVAGSGFYTNRLRPGDFARAFAVAGFDVETVAVERWPRLPLPRRALARAFAGLPEDELLVLQLQVILTLASAP